MRKYIVMIVLACVGVSNGQTLEDVCAVMKAGQELASSGRYTAAKQKFDSACDQTSRADASTMGIKDSVVFVAMVRCVVGAKECVDRLLTVAGAKNAVDEAATSAAAKAWLFGGESMSDAVTFATVSSDMTQAQASTVSLQILQQLDIYVTEFAMSVNLLSEKARKAEIRGGGKRNPSSELPADGAKKSADHALSSPTQKSWTELMVEKQLEKEGSEHSKGGKLVESQISPALFKSAGVEAEAVIKGEVQLDDFYSYKISKASYWSVGIKAGDVYFHGYVKKDSAEERKIIKTIEDGKEHWGLLKLKHMKGMDSAYVHVLAFEELIEAKDAELSAADLYNLGVDNGRSGNTDEAIKYYKLAIAKGYAAAENNLGWMYYVGKGVEIDYMKAVQLFRSSVQKNCSLAQESLGRCYYKGRGVEKNFKEAVRLFKLSAKQKEECAMFGLAKCLFLGRGCAKDEVAAVELLIDSAEAGCADAMYMLADLLERGECVKKNQEKADEWFKKAIQKGHKPAKRRVYGMTSVLDAEDTEDKWPWTDEPPYLTFQ